jgi:hypothetical protein
MNMGQIHLSDEDIEKVVRGEDVNRCNHHFLGIRCSGHRGHCGVELGHHGNGNGFTWDEGWEQRERISNESGELFMVKFRTQGFSGSLSMIEGNEVVDVHLGYLKKVPKDVKP